MACDANRVPEEDLSDTGGAEFATQGVAAGYLFEDLAVLLKV
jgi:hypothetical protein